MASFVSLLTSCMCFFAERNVLEIVWPIVRLRAPVDVVVAAAVPLLGCSGGRRVGCPDCRVCGLVAGAGPVPVFLSCSLGGNLGGNLGGAS